MCLYFCFVAQISCAVGEDRLVGLCHALCDDGERRALFRVTYSLGINVVISGNFGISLSDGEDNYGNTRRAVGDDAGQYSIKNRVISRRMEENHFGN